MVKKSSKLRDLEEDLAEQKRRGYPAIGELTIFIDKYNGNFIMGKVIRQNACSHYDHPIWDCEVMEAQNEAGVSFDPESMGAIICFDRSEHRAAMIKRSEVE